MDANKDVKVLIDKAQYAKYATIRLELVLKDAFWVFTRVEIIIFRKNWSFCAFEAWKGNKEHNLDISYPIDASNKIVTIGLVVF